MKKMMLLLMVFAGLSAKACWFDEENFQKIYFAGVNNYVAHTVFDTVSPADITKVKYLNNQSASLPITPWFVVQPLTGRDGQQFSVTYMALYVRTLYADNSVRTQWRRVREIYQNLPHTSGTPTPIFGKYSVTAAAIGLTPQPGHKIQLLWYCHDENGFANGETPYQNYPAIRIENTADFLTVYDGRYTPPFVMQLIYDGKTIPTF